jgi:hypothetical protein
MVADVIADLATIRIETIHLRPRRILPKVLYSSVISALDEIEGPRRDVFIGELVSGRTRMLRKHWFIAAAAFFGVGAVLGLLNVIGPFLASHIAAIAQQRPPQHLIEASVEMEAESGPISPLFAELLPE